MKQALYYTNLLPMLPLINRKVGSRALFKNCASFVAVCFAALTITLTCYTPSAKADAIYHAFDECFANIKAELPKIQASGYNYIQVSPPNKTA